MAGELSSGQKPSRESDVYAFGGLILNCTHNFNKVMSSQAPFHGLSHLVILRRIILNNPPKPEDHPDLPAQDPLWDLMRRCWNPLPAARPTIYEVLIELREDIDHKEHNPQPSSDVAIASGEGGNDYLNMNFKTSGKHLKEGINSLNTSQKTRDPALEAPLKAKSLSSSSSDGLSLPSVALTIIPDSNQPTRTDDGWGRGSAFPRPPMEHQARLNMKPQRNVEKKLPKERLEDPPIREMAALWIHSAPPKKVASVSDKEKRRQEAINELICTERDFVRDMEYLRDFWVKPLLTRDIIPEQHRAKFVRQVFYNLNEIITINMCFRDALNQRQKSSVIIEMIGDIFCDADFGHFRRYGGGVPYGMYEVRREKHLNQPFVQFVQETERLPESRKLDLNDYLKKPTAHLSRFTFLLESVLTYTSDNHRDKVLLEKVVETTRGVLKHISEKSAKKERRLMLMQLHQHSVFWDVEQVDLRLRDKNRELIHMGRLRLGGGQGDNCDLRVFLLDNALLTVKTIMRQGYYDLYKQPIPLELLVAQAELGPIPGPPGTNSFEIQNETRYPIWLTCLGRKGYTLMLGASAVVDRDKWLEEIVKQQEVTRTRNATFETLSLDLEYSRWHVTLNCAVPLNDGNLIAYGSEHGVHLPDLRDGSSGLLMCALALPDVKQLNVLLECRLLVLLSERSVMTVPLDALNAREDKARPNRLKTVATNVSFFQVGTYFGRTLLCLVNASLLRSTIKVLEPNDKAIGGKKKSNFKESISGENDAWRVFQEFEILTEVTSVHFLRNQFCVGCTQGVQMIDLDTLAVRPLLHGTDPLLDFVRKGLKLGDRVTKPSAIYRIGNDFLLCYDEFAFYVDEAGRRARPDWIVHWEGYPTLHYPFVLAFEQTFIEIHNVESGQLAQIIPGKDIRCLFADTVPSITRPAANNGNTSLELREGLDINVFQEQPTGGPGAAIGMASADPYPRDEIIVVSDDKVMAVQLAPSKIGSADDRF
ncbi:RHO1 GDP-GTP exchange protein 2 [Tulasnella sp. 408]|nr:RHO1 GDP-GTP exchange protein 2 [Tulasnella sp. 408]